jgi:hypothetical protein
VLTRIITDLYPFFNSSNNSFPRTLTVHTQDHTMATPMNQFMADEYVLAYHGPLLYEARVSTCPTLPDHLRCFVQSLKPIRAGCEALC